MLNRPVAAVSWCSANLTAFVSQALSHEDGVGSDNADVYAFYGEWSRERGDEPASHRALSRAMIKAGYRQASRRDHGRVWINLRVG